MNFRFETYHSDHYSLWNHFIQNCENATFLFHRDFMEYHKDRFPDFSLLIFKNNELKAILPGTIEGDILYSHKGLTYGGVLHADDLKLNDTIKLFHAMLSFLNEKGIKKIILKELPLIYFDTIVNHSLDYLMFKLNAKLLRTDLLSVVSLDNKLKFSKNRIEGVKRAKKHHLLVKEEQDFNSFWNDILAPNLKEKHQAKPVHSLSEITYLKQNFKNNIRQFNVYYNDEIVAGTTIFESKHVAHSQYISANNDKNRLGSLDFLHDYLLNQVFNKKRYFDFGISNINEGQQINEGLLFWKEGFGARSVPQRFFEVETKYFNHLEDIFV